MSVLRVFHALLSDREARARPALRPALVLATRVTRNLMTRLVPEQAADGVETAESGAGDNGGEQAEVGSGRCPAAESQVRRRFRDVSGRHLPEGRALHDVHGAVLNSNLPLPIQSPSRAQAKESCTSMLFVELMFWKTAAVAEDVREHYHWQVRWAVGGRRGAEEMWREEGEARGKGSKVYHALLLWMLAACMHVQNRQSRVLPPDRPHVPVHAPGCRGTCIPPRQRQSLEAAAPAMGLAATTKGAPAAAPGPAVLRGGWTKSSWRSCSACLRRATVPRTAWAAWSRHLMAR